MQRAIAKALEAIPDGLGKATGVRKVSLKGIDAAVRRAAQSGGQLPDSIVYLSGLQQTRLWQACGVLRLIQSAVVAQRLMTRPR